MEKEEREMMVCLIKKILTEKKPKVRECHPKIFNGLAISIQAEGYKITEQEQDVYGIHDPFFNFISRVWSEPVDIIGLIDSENRIAQELHDEGYRITKEEPVTA